MIIQPSFSRITNRCLMIAHITGLVAMIVPVWVNGQEKPLTVRQARICVTAADHNRPDDYP
ncbi:MAG: hypothetical protein OSB47_00420, partial [Pirellulaceae bacterium]|nr:hypothetical protein [Pirellulaceae bacterium]